MHICILHMDNGIAAQEHELKAETSSIFFPAKLKLDFIMLLYNSYLKFIAMFIFSKRLNLENDVAEPFVLFWTNESHNCHPESWGLFRYNDTVLPLCFP